jgi:hypothetical protein
MLIDFDDVQAFLVSSCLQVLVFLRVASLVVSFVAVVDALGLFG